MSADLRSDNSEARRLWEFHRYAVEHGRALPPSLESRYEIPRDPNQSLRAAAVLVDLSARYESLTGDCVRGEPLCEEWTSDPVAEPTWVGAHKQQRRGSLLK